MDRTIILDEKTLKRILPLFTLIFILLLGFPAIAIHFFGTDFSTMAKDVDVDNSFGVVIVEAQIRGYFRQILLQWSAFALSVMTVMFALIKYRLTNDKIALIIGLSILFSGSIEVLHTLVIDGLSPFSINKNTVDSIILAFTNGVSGLIFAAGLLLLLHYENKPIFRVSTLFLLSLFFISIAVTFIYYVMFEIKNAPILAKDLFIPRSYELLDLSIYISFLSFIYPRAYKAFPGILMNCIFYMAITQIVLALYLILLPSYPYDNTHNIAYYLKIIGYFIPFSSLIINYVFSYNTILEAQQTLQKNQQTLKYFASHDPLTNLYNRREFENLIEIAIANSARHHHSFAIFFIDIDNFKSINDTLGHLYGDSFLIKFSEQLVALTRKGDILSRIGGDEFTVITSKLNAPAAAKKMAERMIHGLSSSYLIDKKLLSRTVSIGLSIYPNDGKTAKELFKHADLALYNAKKSGKNTYCLG